MSGAGASGVAAPARDAGRGMQFAKSQGRGALHALRPPPRRRDKLTGEELRCSKYSLESAPRCETDVRVWSGAGADGTAVPELADGPWTVLPPQAVPDAPSLPALVLHGSGCHLPLTLKLTASAAAAVLPVERVWVQAQADEDGRQAYRTRCLLRPRQTHFLDVELPAALGYRAR